MTTRDQQAVKYALSQGYVVDQESLTIEWILTERDRALLSLKNIPLLNSRAIRFNAHACTDPSCNLHSEEAGDLLEALNWIASYYLRLDHLRDISGVSEVTPERAVEAIVDHLMPSFSQGFLKCCQGYGSAHFWKSWGSADTLTESCRDHPERRKRHRRQSC